MRVAHSLWSKPLKKNRWFLNNQFSKSIWLYALSYLYIKERGYTAILHTDEIGSKLLGKIPYDEINVTLDTLNNFHQKFWAAGKIKTIELEDLGTIHIDGDVFLKKDLIDTKFNSDYDVICQMIEAGDLFDKGYRKQLPYFDYALRNVNIQGYGLTQHAYNGGVLGFKDPTLREKFLWNFYVMVEEAYKDYRLMFEMDGSLEPNIILEQYQLAGLAELSNSKTCFILSPKDIHKIGFQATADKYGFVHAWGKSKYEDSFQDRVKELIKSKDKTLYRILLRNKIK